MRNRSYAIVTIVTKSHLAYANILHQSCQAFFPESEFFCLLIGADQAIGLEHTQSMKIVDAALVVESPLWQQMLFQYTAFEMCCALKPFALLYLAELGFKNLIYLDSDISLHSFPQSLVESLEEFPIVLTPHAAVPHSQELERFYLTGGAFNAGSVACRNCETGISFLNWWKDRLATGCCDEIASGLFVDQKWLDLVPGMFAGTGILRNPGFNTGHWTLKSHKMRSAEGAVFVADHRLEAFHHSYLSTVKACDDFFHEGHCDETTYITLKTLVTAYESRINPAKSQCSESANYPFAHLPNGTRIKRDWQIAYRNDESLRQRFPQPFELNQGKEVGRLVSKAKFRERLAKVLNRILRKK
jgi:hypothetical protein